MKIKYVAEIEDVIETTLFGDADYSYWQKLLAPTGLTPVDKRGRAELLLSATQGRFRGITFREFSVSVAVIDPVEAFSPPAWYMVHAFNSLRSFAWIERVMFSTPYYFGRIRVNVDVTALMAVAASDGDMLVRMNGAASQQDVPNGRRPLRTGAEEWEGWIYLPSRKRGEDRVSKRFYARIGGNTTAYAFDPELDELRISPAGRAVVFERLIVSRFVGREWNLRPSASHAKSATYRFR